MNGHHENADFRLTVIAEQLVSESACDLRTDSGQTIEVWTIEAHGAVVLASAPRLLVRAGMNLEWRTRIESTSTPVVATIVVEEATYQSPQRARLGLRVTSIRHDASHRRHARRAIAVPATLTAVSCDRIVDRDVIAATISDISDTGIGVKTGDHRPRTGDRFVLHIHSLGAQLHADVRVTRVSHGDASTDLGCSVIDDSPAVVDQIRRILDRLGPGESMAA